MSRRRRRGPPWPLLVAVVQTVAGAATRQLDWRGYLLLLAGPAVLLWSRNRGHSESDAGKGLAVAAVCTITLTYLSLGFPLGPAAPATVIAVVIAVTNGRRAAAWACMTGLYLGWLALGLADLRELGGLWQELRWLGLALLVAAFAEVLDNRRQRITAFRRLYAEEQRRRTEEQRRRVEEQRRISEEKLRRAEEQQRRMSEQRLTIARELHDVLAHSLSLITVRASVALELMDTHPEEVRKALQAIKEASKGGLDEVRSVLSNLRDEPAPLVPAPSLDRLEELVTQTPGLRVTLTRTGAGPEIPTAVSLAGYRIIQEALTNVLRHSQSREAVVHVHRTPWAVLIGVSDDGPAIEKSTTDGGNGLIGVQERAAALGGYAETGPQPGGGFAVQVALPVGRA